MKGSVYQINKCTPEITYLSSLDVFDKCCLLQFSYAFKVLSSFVLAFFLLML